MKRRSKYKELMDDINTRSGLYRASAVTINRSASPIGSICSSIHAFTQLVITL